MPRSLNDPVGLAPSSFRRTRRADHLREHGRAQQRRGALLQADQRIAGRERQALAIALDQRHVSARRRYALHRWQRHLATLARRSSRTPLRSRGSCAGGERTKSNSRSSAIAARRRDSATACVTITRRAFSPRPRCTTDLIDTPCSPSTRVTAASTPGRIGDVEVQVERARRRPRAGAAPAAARAVARRRSSRSRRRPAPRSRSAARRRPGRTS